MRCDKINFLIVVAITFTLNLPATNIPATEQDRIISVKLDKVPLYNVIEDIMQQTKYRIIVDINCGNPKISGLYENYPLEKFFTNILNNIVILINYDSRIVNLNCIAPSAEEKDEKFRKTSQNKETTHNNKNTQPYQTEELDILESTILVPMPKPKSTPKVPRGFDEMEE